MNAETKEQRIGRMERYLKAQGICPDCLNHYAKHTLDYWGKMMCPVANFQVVKTEKNT